MRTTRQVGYPPSIATDAQPGYSVMAYQSVEILFESCDGGGSILGRLEGSGPLGHPGTQDALTKRAKVGCCPCCTKETHIAAPPRYSVGVRSNDKAHGLQLRPEHGPRSARRFAAFIYGRPYGYLPRNWDWCARPLRTSAPALFKSLLDKTHALRTPNLSPPDAQLPPTTTSERDSEAKTESPMTVS